MFKRGILLILLPLLLSVNAEAQRTRKFTEAIQYYEHGKMLYLKEQYIPAIEDFELFIKYSRESNLIYEARAYIELSRLHLGKRNAASNLSNLIKEQPEHKLNGEIVYQLGLYYFQEEKYKRALRFLEDIKEDDLPKNKREELIFKKGYSYFMDEEYELAKTEFAKLLNSNGPYAIQASYYYGYQCYVLKDYDCALRTFEKIGDKGPKTMKIYMAQIYYERNEYDKAYSLIKDLEIESRKDDLELLKGKINYQLGNYSVALSHFEAYKGQVNELSSDEIFQFAHVYFLAEKYEKSGPLFLKIANLENEIGQAANYHLGVSDINTGEKARAMNAFAEAKRKNYDPRITEISAFNYAKLAAELKQNSVAINALRSFMEEYPNSEFQSEAQNIMTSIYLSTKNYKAAISMIESTEKLDEGTKEAYQILTYHRGEELYLNRDYKESAIYFRKSLKYVKDRKLEAQAHFWLGQIAFHENRYSECIQEQLAFLNSSASNQSKEQPYALYSIGYAYYKLNDFRTASLYFSKYKKENKHSIANHDLYIDNTLRLADCYFLARDYPNAIKQYGEVISLDYKSADYALYQQGLLYGLTGQVQKKIDALRKIQKDFPKSVYADDALFQIGSEYLELGNYSMAENMFSLIISQYDWSTYLPNSYLRMGLIYYNQGKDNTALGYYKTVVERFPNTAASNEAMPYIKEIYIRQGKSDEYLDWAANQGVKISVSEKDSSMFESAMARYRVKDCAGAVKGFKAYIKEFGSEGFFSTHANFYKAECDYFNGRVDEALDHYEYVVSRSTNEFSEISTFRLAYNYYIRKNYRESLDHYMRLEQLATTESNFLESLIGQMRCNYLLNNYDKSKEKAIAILPRENVPKEKLVEVHMTLGRIQMRESNYGTARFHFDYVIENSRNAQSAEALYNRALIKYEQNDLDSARDDVFLLNDDFTAYEFWVVKGFILLSDIYLKEKDHFQAKATLQSILDNYKKEDDGLLDICRMKLKEIEKLEKN